METQGDKALALLRDALDRWGPSVDDPTREIRGADAVEWLCDFIENAQAILQRKEFNGLLRIRKRRARRSDCRMDDNGFCSIHRRVHLRERAEEMGIK
jgi:hypothetical protein